MQKTHLYKRCLRALVLMLILALPLCSLAESYKVVTGGSLNLRKEPSLYAEVLKQYPSGTWMTVHSEENGWSKVTVNGQTGYVVSKYLSDGTNTTTLYVRTNTGRGLNLRDQPSLQGNILGSYKTGTPVSVIARGSGWYKVSVDGQTGYMSSQYLSSNASTGSSTSTGYPKTGTVKNPGANQVLLLRQQPSTDAKVLGFYRNGTTVELLGESGSFYKVKVNGQSGYMMKKYIVVSDASVTAVPFEATLINPNGNSIVNFRSGAGLNAPIIKAYPVGTKISVTAMGDVWCKVEIDGVSGYVSRYFFQKTK